MFPCGPNVIGKYTPWTTEPGKLSSYKSGTCGFATKDIKVELASIVWNTMHFLPYRIIPTITATALLLGYEKAKCVTTALLQKLPVALEDAGSLKSPHDTRKSLGDFPRKYACLNPKICLQDR